MDAFDAKTRADVIDEDLQHGQEFGKSEIAAVILDLTGIKLTEFSPAVLGAWADDGVGEEKDHEESLSKHVNTKSFLVIFSGFLKNAVKTIVER